MYNIVFAGDDKYIKYIALAITSIVNSTDKSKKIQDFQEDINKEVHGENFTSSENLDQEEGYIFHVLTDFIQDDTKAKLKGLEEELNKIFPTKIISYVVPDKEFRGFPTWRKSYLTYYRFKLSEILPKDVKKALYLDGDMLILKDIRELFAVDLDNQPFMPVCESKNMYRRFEKLSFVIEYKTKTVSFFTKENIDEEKKPILEIRGRNFNAGLLLISLENWQKEQISEKCCYFLQYYKANFLDQDALNTILPNFISLPNPWNVEALNTESILKKLLNGKELSIECDELCMAIRQSVDFKNIHFNKRKPWASSGIRLEAGKMNLTYIPFIQIWWEEASKIPYFNKDLLDIKESKKYKKAVHSEKRLLELSYRKNLFKIYLFFVKCNNKIKALTRKVEKPIKQIRNKMRYKLANK